MIKTWKQRIESKDSGYWSVVTQAMQAEIDELRKALDVKTVDNTQTDSYVQIVPDKCDRIVWKNMYYHLPLGKRLSEDWMYAKWDELNSGLGSGWQPVIEYGRAIEKELT